MAPLQAVLQELKAQSAPASHLQRLERLVQLAEREAALQALVLVGSYAKQTGNRVSDLDLVALVADGMEAQVLASADATLNEPDVLNSFGGRHRTSGVFRKYVYLDFSSVEFHVFGASSGFRLYRPYLTLWDPSKQLARYEVDGQPIQHEDFEPYEYGDEGLVWELVDCIKWLVRGRTELSKRYLVKLGRKLDEGAKR